MKLFEIISEIEHPDYILNNPKVTISGGKIRLYHFGDDGGTGVLSPEFFGTKSYTLSDLKQWNKKRVMFYINPEDKEAKVSGKQYVIDYPLDKLYPFNSDPLNFYNKCSNELKRENLPIQLQLSCMGEKAEKIGFDGMILKWMNTLRVDIWEPIKVSEPKQEEKPKIIGIIKNLNEPFLKGDFYVFSIPNELPSLTNTFISKDKTSSSGDFERILPEYLWKFVELFPDFKNVGDYNTEIFRKIAF